MSLFSVMKPLRTRGYLATTLQTLTEYQGSFAGEVEGTLMSTGITVPRRNQATYQCDNRSQLSVLLIRSFVTTINLSS